MWGGVQTRKTSVGAGDLLELIIDYQLELLLPVGTKTRQERGEPSTIDLIFRTQMILESVVSCNLAENELNHNSDHLSIITLLNMNIIKHPGKK